MHHLTRSASLRNYVTGVMVLRNSGIPEIGKAGKPEIRTQVRRQERRARRRRPRCRCLGLGVAVEDGARPGEPRSAGEQRRLTDQENRGDQEAVNERGATRLCMRSLRSPPSRLRRRAAGVRTIIGVNVHRLSGRLGGPGGGLQRPRSPHRCGPYPGEDRTG